MGALTTVKKIKPPAPTIGEDSARKDGDARQGHHENGNGVEAAEEILHPEIDQLDAENHEPESDREAEHLGNSPLEVRYIEEPLDASTDDVSLHDEEELGLHGERTSGTRHDLQQEEYLHRLDPHANEGGHGQKVPDPQG